MQPEREQLLRQGVSDEALSLAWEATTGCDSIATIERVYDQTPVGAYVCIYPDCSFTRRDAAALWRHVHSSHGQPSLPPADFEPGTVAMTGRRRDVPLHEMEPGDYGFTAAWFCCAPNGFAGNLSRHEVVEHEDGTISVSPSILISGADDSWHGYLERGVWRSV